MIEIESYEEKIPSLARAGWKTTSATKTYRVKDKNTNTVFVKYILKATFRYNGKKAECTNATPDCKILVPNVYKVITKDASKAGDVALGYFYCQHIKQEKVLEEHFQLSVPQTDQSLLVDAGENKFCFAVI